MRKQLTWAVVVGLVTVAAAVGIVQGQQLSGEYKIGVLQPLTGNLAAEGKRHLEGYEASFASMLLHVQYATKSDDVTALIKRLDYGRLSGRRCVDATDGCVFVRPTTISARR